MAVLLFSYARQEMDYTMTERKQTLAEVREQKYGAINPTRTVEPHETIGEVADTAAKATRVVATVAVAGAAIAAPTGLTAVGVAIGVVSAPAIVTAAPILVGVAAGAAAISAAFSLYSKFKRRR